MGGRSYEEFPGFPEKGECPETGLETMKEMLLERYRKEQVSERIIREAKSV